MCQDAVVLFVFPASGKLCKQVGKGDLPVESGFIFVAVGKAFGILIRRQEGIPFLGQVNVGEPFAVKFIGVGERNGKYLNYNVDCLKYQSVWLEKACQSVKLFF